MKTRILLVFSFLILNSSCKKWQHEFPEDGGRTKETPLQRINRTWVLDKVTINAQDYTDSIQNKFGKYTIFFSQILSETNIQTGVKSFASEINCEKEPFFGSLWSFHSIDTLNIRPFQGNNTNTRSVIPGYLDDFVYNKKAFKILKLTSNELKITINTKSGDSVIINHFKPL